MRLTRPALDPDYASDVDPVLAYGLAAAVIAVQIVFYPAFLAVAAILAPGAHAFHAQIEALNAQADARTELEAA